ncbi:glioma pathogenesis-related protein 1-like [Mytilus trossulus]|uniref:glioma pathogenesis-related protein 1-like n=1 Tax=Mytilus trossulus TaxID=6551 RepID=UPI0030078FAC
MIPEEIAEKLLSNAISDKEKSSTESDQQDSSTRQLTDRDIIKAIKREQTENPWKFKKDGDKDETTNTMKRYHEWFNNPDRIKRGRNSVFGNQPDKRGRNPGIGNQPGKRKMNSLFGNPPYKRRRNLGIGDALTRDIMSNAQKRQVNSATEAATLDIKGVTKPCRLSDEEAARAVAVHRAYRKKEYADNMWTMDWNGTLADLAQGLADECTFKHTNLQTPSGVHVGQNLGATTGSDHSIERMVGLYMNEKDNYNYKDHQWIGVVGHYLQVVNWKTIQVGCAMNKCDNLYISTPTQQEVWKNAWYWVCDYWPPVSTKSRPYDSTNGQACSECMVPKGSGLGWKCIDQTCRDCKLDGSDPDCRKYV